MTSVTVSEERLAPLSTGVEVCYQTFGNADDEPLLLIMGLGGPMTWWDEEFCAQLAAEGFHVIRYDNRDTGRSTKLRDRHLSRPDLVRAFLGFPGKVAYGLEDMAADALALLDHLAIESAHLVGISMGGMIAQTTALLAPGRSRSLTSISSTTGNRLAGWQHPRLIPGLLRRTGGDRESYVSSSVAFWRLISSPGYPASAEESAERAGITWDRGFSASGVVRQMVAVITQPDRTPGLRSLRIPGLVIHGLDDRMVHVSGGRETARALPDAELMLLPGMGHDLPEELYPTFVSAIRRVADRAGRGAHHRLD